MPNALTLDDMSPGLRKVVGRESPRVTSTEEPDGGNLLVRIWRGAGVGNLPAYSTTAFLPDVCGSAPPEPHRLDAAAPLGPTAGACRSARWRGAGRVFRVLRGREP